MSDTDKQEAPTTAAIRQQHLDKADYLNMFGTITSLVSTLAFLVEGMNKKLPPIVQKITLGLIVAGIAGVFASIYYKVKANRMKPEQEKTAPVILEPVPVQTSSVLEKVNVSPASPAAKQWVADMQSRAVSAPMEQAL